MSVSNACDLIDACMPAPVREVCAVLKQAGHEAYAVGGAVRDAIMGRTPGDWDVATSALPEEVIGLFKKTIPTGMKHGTVTVLHGRPERMPIEVTTFRGEGEYIDGRHPESVTFGVPLHEDLARRDFVVNAIAYDPIARVLADPFDGAGDIERAILRAVGDPAERFTEDGLRVMRAVRFAAVLGLRLDSATEAAIPGALPVLAKVSRERVRDELTKLLKAERPSAGLVIAQRTGILDAILPELRVGASMLAPSASPDQAASSSLGSLGSWEHTLRRVDAAQGLLVRLAALGAHIPAPLPPARAPEHPLRRLTFSNHEIERADALIRGAFAWRTAMDDAHLRRFLGELGRDVADDLMALWRAEAAAAAGSPDAERALAMAERTRAVLEAGDPLTTRDLALSGGELIRELGLAPGPTVGKLLAELLERALVDPRINTREQLLATARALRAEDGIGSA